MKFFHLSDLHLGKRVNGYPMLDDQKYILEKVIELIDRDHPDAVIIAGDVYDKSIPPVEAVNLFDDFLVSLVARGLQVFIISGNHDSAERVSYGGRVMEQSGIHISRRITGARGTGWTHEEDEDGGAGMSGDEEEDSGAGMPGDEEDAGPEKAADQKTGKKLQSLIVITDGGKPIEISPAKFGRLRPVIAAQNGIEIPPLDANPELVEADRAVRMMNAPKLEMVLEDKVSFVALASGADENEIYDWPILKFNRRSIAAERVLSYLIYGIGENSGMVKYKNGNPCPSPYFRRKQQSLGMMALSEFRRGAEQEINKAHQTNK